MQVTSGTHKKDEKNKRILLLTSFFPTAEADRMENDKNTRKIKQSLGEAVPSPKAHFF
jgi:hypothetical protein